jgi:uncharacterized protein YjiS (DUF1127 family)
MSETSVASNDCKPGIFQAIGRTLRAVRNAYRRRQTAHELSGLDNHILQDIGIDRAALNVPASSGCGKTRDTSFVSRHQIG